MQNQKQLGRENTNYVKPLSQALQFQGPFNYSVHLLSVLSETIRIYLPMSFCTLSGVPSPSVTEMGKSNTILQGNLNKHFIKTQNEI